METERQKGDTDVESVRKGKHDKRVHEKSVLVLEINRRTGTTVWTEQVWYEKFSEKNRIHIDWSKLTNDEAVDATAFVIVRIDRMECVWLKYDEQIGKWK